MVFHKSVFARPTIGTPHRASPPVSLGPHPYAYSKVSRLLCKCSWLTLLLVQLLSSAKAAFRHLACSWRSMQLQSMWLAAIDVVFQQHFTTFTSVVAAGCRAGNGCVAIGWRVEKANIVCVILQGSLQSLCEALRPSVCGACRFGCRHLSPWAHVVIMPL